MKNAVLRGLLQKCVDWFDSGGNNRQGVMDYA